MQHPQARAGLRSRAWKLIGILGTAGAILLSPLGLPAEVGPRVRFAFLEFAGGVTKQIYWQAVSRREFIFGGFRSLLPNLAGLISIRASSSFASVQDAPNPAQALCWAGFSSSLPQVWLLSKGPAVGRLPSPCLCWKCFSLVI